MAAAWRGVCISSGLASTAVMSHGGHWIPHLGRGALVCSPGEGGSSCLARPLANPGRKKARSSALPTANTTQCNARSAASRTSRLPGHFRGIRMARMAYTLGMNIRIQAVGQRVGQEEGGGGGHYAAAFGALHPV